MNETARLAKESIRDNNKLEIITPFNTVRCKVDMKCLVCESIISQVTPLSKTQCFKKGNRGCPTCQREARYGKLRADNLDELRDRGIEVLTEGYDGRRHVYDEDGKLMNITVRNSHCGHIFSTLPTNLLGRKGYNCYVCGKLQRSNNLTANSIQRSEEWQDTAPEWLIYKSEVTGHTRRNYELNEMFINPKGLVRGKAGEEGAYQLDHIVSVRWCFDNNVPADICGHPQNLELLPWRDNNSKGAKLSSRIPPIIRPYVNEAIRMELIRNDVCSEVGDAVEVSVSDGMLTITSNSQQLSLTEDDWFTDRDAYIDRMIDWTNKISTPAN